MHRYYSILFGWLCVVFFAIVQPGVDGILYPRASETREVLGLDGLWNFVALCSSNPQLGHEQEWYKTRLNKMAEATLMPVPSSYNDITTSQMLRDHVGVVWYDRSFFMPKSWSGKRVWLRFSSVHYSADVWVNGKMAMSHKIGHLPFQAEVSKHLEYGKENVVTVACDNTLLNTTVPQGLVKEFATDEGKKIAQTYTFDFFNYAGIHRPVVLYTTPINYIEDITIETDILDATTASIQYGTAIMNSTDELLVGVKLYNQNDEFIISNSGLSGCLKIADPHLWWPYLMNETPGYQYTLQVELNDQSGNLIDIYRQSVGIRKLQWNNTNVMINNQPLYLMGFGRHEDADIRGKGLDLPTIIRDHNLIKWIGANAYRTSHYPYAEEILDVTDRLGIMIIDECPAVNIDYINDELLEAHLDSITEMIRRDKNRPSVIAWSVANEPRSQKPNTAPYFEAVANHARRLDRTRPITASLNRRYDEDKLAEFLDVISFNRYNSWYRNEGRLDMIINNVVDEATNWHDRYNKPILMSEYGADTMEGMHALPEFIWSEEYQVAVMSRHFEAFDSLRVEGWFVGEFIWNFADFRTAQTITRVGGNKKGIFTRNRQPKASAHHLRRRYFHLANELYNASMPHDLHNYVINGDGTLVKHIEL